MDTNESYTEEDLIKVVVGTTAGILIRYVLDGDVDLTEAKQTFDKLEDPEAHNYVYDIVVPEIYEFVRDLIFKTKTDYTNFNALIMKAAAEFDITLEKYQSLSKTSNIPDLKLQ
jgi:hypothetical protein